MANNHGNLMIEKETAVNLDATARNNLDEMENHGKRREFVSFIENADWPVYGVAVLRRALDLALFFDMVPLSRKLAKKGFELFPKNKDFQYFVKVLAPPKIISTQPGENFDLLESQQWLKKNASKYKGQWIAVNKGRLLGVASNYNMLKKKVGAFPKKSNTVVVKVLD